MISMAVAFSHSNIIIPRSQTEKIRRRSCLCRHHHHHHNNNNTSEASVSVNKFSSRGAKVYEDQETGVICFRDDKGEIVCEGFDEGPRFDQPILKRSRRNRELQSIPSFLQILMAEGDEGDEFYRFTCN
ncbi:hypothetical protein ZIOFF_048483 [Zingiber officinale]|uniref:Uncharacterized protein n=1 Tax=Zingiber officinale TaxID=94328 RepID=A0A8J5FQP4_ZINOF|nr:hypothetical protein ZIOFF_048483 [Zingiber officinale]